MIARTWQGRTTRNKADDYRRHFLTEVVPNLNRIAGHGGAYLLRREIGEEVVFMAITLWDSFDTLKRFSGDDVEAAHVEPAGRAALTSFDDCACNYEIVCDTVGGKAQ